MGKRIEEAGVLSLPKSRGEIKNKKYFRFRNFSVYQKAKEFGKFVKKLLREALGKQLIGFEKKLNQK